MHERTDTGDGRNCTGVRDREAYRVLYLSLSNKYTTMDIQAFRDEMQARKTRPTVERVYRVIYWVLGVVVFTLLAGTVYNVYKVITILGV